MEPGTYHISALVKGYRQEKSIDLDVGATREDLVLPLAPALEILVKTIDATTSDVIRGGCVSLVGDGSKSTSCGGGPGAGKFSSLRPGSFLAAAWAPGYALGYHLETIDADSREVNVSLGRGGSLRISLPANVVSEEDSLLKAAVRIRDTNGVELIDLLRSVKPSSEPWFVSLEPRIVLIPRVPAGTLKVSIGGEGSLTPPKMSQVKVDEGVETPVDLQ
jgi:hypothetical protein